MALTKRGCHGCGAPLPEHSTTCAYCGSTHGNVTMSVSRYTGGSNVQNVRIAISSGGVGIQRVYTTASYDTYFDGTSVRRVRIG